MTALSRGAILSASNIPSEEVQVPEWGGAVIVKAMTAKERDAFEEFITRERKGGGREIDPADFRAKFVVRVVVDEEGNRLFSDDDVLVLSEKSAVPLDRIYDVGARLAGMRKEDAARLAGNSSAQSDASTTV